MSDHPHLLSVFSEQATTALKQVKLLCCDVDGVLTDGGMYYGTSGQTMLRFHVLDGMGIKMLKATGIKTCLITMSKTDIIKSRSEVIGMDYCCQGIEDKLAHIKNLQQTLNISMQETAHIGDDVNDLQLLENVGCPVTVPNGVDEVKRAAKFITNRSGGNGAVRDLCDALIKAKQ